MRTKKESLINLLNRKEVIALATLLVIAIVVLSFIFPQKKDDTLTEVERNVKADLYAKSGKVTQVGEDRVVFQIALAKVDAAGVAEPYFEERIAYLTPQTEINQQTASSSGIQMVARSRSDIRPGNSIIVYSLHDIDKNRDFTADKIDIQ